MSVAQNGGPPSLGAVDPQPFLASPLAQTRPGHGHVHGDRADLCSHCISQIPAVESGDATAAGSHPFQAAVGNNGMVFVNVGHHEPRGGVPFCECGMTLGWPRSAQETASQCHCFWSAGAKFLGS